MNIYFLFRKIQINLLDLFHWLEDQHNHLYQKKLYRKDLSGLTCNNRMFSYQTVRKNDQKRLASNTNWDPYQIRSHFPQIFLPFHREYYFSPALLHQNQI